MNVKSDFEMPHNLYYAVYAVFDFTLLLNLMKGLL